MALYLLKYGELFLKSERSRPRFIKHLQSHIQSACGGTLSVKRDHMVLANPSKPENIPKIPGIKKYAEVSKVEKSEKALLSYFSALHLKGKAFGIKASRSSKDFPLNSEEIQVKVGQIVKDKGNTVNLSNPEITFYVEVCDEAIFIHKGYEEGLGGLPYGSAGKILLLFSGGIDSTVSAHLLAKKGVEPVLAFFNPGGEPLLYYVEKAKKAAEASVAHPMEFLCADSSQLMVEIQKVPEKYRQIALKLVFYREARELMELLGIKAMATGESLSQVSTQTLSNLIMLTTFPVFRPVLAYDKEEIIAIARRAGLYDACSRVPEHCIVSSGRVAVRAEQEALYFADKVRYSARWAPCKLRSKEKRAGEVINLDSADLSRLKLKKGRRYIITCKSGVQSRLLAEELVKKGYDATWEVG
ncbi:MAG: THUMP domain-containing protein [Candidatus Anstonellales archaeon]